MKKRDSIKTFFLLAEILLYAEISHAVDIYSGPQSFCYDDPSCGPKSSLWGGVCQTGKLQSPINIMTAPPDAIVDVPGTIPIQKFGSDTFYVQNNGHSVTVNFAPVGNNARIFPGHGLSTTKYRFANLHFHWGSSDNMGSEHTVNGNKYSMEMHLVHFRADFKDVKAAVASGESNALAVFGVFLQVDPNSSPNPTLKPIIKVLPKIHETHTLWVKGESPIDFTGLIKRPGGDTIYAYKGSLTTPDCQQVVAWYVKKAPIKISKDDVAAFRKILDGREHALTSNHRPVQPLNKRHIHIIKTK